MNIVRLNPDLARVGDLALFVTHTKMYMRVQILLRTGNGARSWTTIVRHQHKYNFSSLFNQSIEY